MCHVPCSKLQETHPVFDVGGSQNGPSTSTSEGAEATNAVFPGGLIGQRGFTSVFDVNRGTYASEHEGAFSQERLADISPKAAKIVDMICTASGIVMVYSNFVWAGVKLLAAALEERGFRPCEFESAITRPARARTTGPRYATLSDGAQVDKILKTARSPENRTGDLIKVLLCTKVVAEGVDMTCIRELHIFEGWWNLSREAQVVGRAVRHASHERLPVQHRNVTVFRYGLTLPGTEKDSIMRWLALQCSSRPKSSGSSKSFGPSPSIASCTSATPSTSLTQIPKRGQDVPHVTSQNVTIRRRRDGGLYSLIASQRCATALY